MKVNFAPPTKAEEIAQNVRTLLATEPGTVPLSRDLGLPQDVVDTPVSTAGAKLQATAIRAVRTYEPRARIKKVRLMADADGVLQATAELVKE